MSSSAGTFVTFRCRIAHYPTALFDLPSASSMTSLLRHALVLVLFSTSLAGQRTERINSFDAQIVVNQDSSLDVRETISVSAAGQRIRHGIYRDFPSSYRDQFGNSHTVGFSVLGLERDGSQEPYHTQPLANGIRIYFGNSQQLLRPGDYTYVLTYQVNRELGFFADHDELYWNVTGNGWDFPIGTATATVIAPDPIRSSILETNAYTGYSGARDRNFTTSRDSQGNPQFSAEGLRPHQGLTIVVTWPKGLIAAPTSQQKLQWLLEDNQALAIGGTGFAIVLLYYVLAWSMVGRDPAPGVVMPLYEPPDNLSPAAARYLRNMNFDNKAFAASILNLAAKGYMQIRRDESLDYELIKNGDTAVAEKQLTPDEKLLARELFEEKNNLYLSQENRGTLIRAQKAISLSLKGSMENIYFVKNGKYMLPGVLLSISAVAWLVLRTASLGTFAGLFMTVWLSGWTVGVTSLLVAAYKAWKAVLQKTDLSTPALVNGRPVGSLAGAVVVSLFAIPFMGFECMGAAMLYKAAGIPTFISVMALLGANVLFHFLLKAPTPAGRRILDHIDGFKMFLSEVDGDRIRRMGGGPAKTPQLFDRLLPYAVAFDMEHKWAQQFAQVVAQAATSTSGSGISYCPTWYSGNGFNAFSAQSFTDSFAGSFVGAVASSSTVPVSSSGAGGGGASGGGGGGGGGGGW